ncbi:MAG: hypothetical protein JW748_12870 [Anaerolineales bacterium]|nr:hypothetical protein [Anaerolineales bacterium]
MGFLDKLLGSLSGGRPPLASSISVKCNRCGEILTARINLANDLSGEYDPKGTLQFYTCRKVLQGNGRCFQSVEVILKYDPQRLLREKEIHGGQFVED